MAALFDRWTCVLSENWRTRRGLEPRAKYAITRDVSGLPLFSNFSSLAMFLFDDPEYIKRLDLLTLLYGCGMIPKPPIREGSRFYDRISSQPTQRPKDRSLPYQHSFDDLAAQDILCRIVHVFGRILNNQVREGKISALPCSYQERDELLRITVTHCTAQVHSTSVDSIENTC